MPITNEAAVERLRDLLADAEHLAAKHKVSPAGYELDAEAICAAIAALERKAVGWVSRRALTSLAAGVSVMLYSYSTEGDLEVPVYANPSENS